MVQECIFSVTNVHKARIQIGHDLPDAANINVTHGVLHIPSVSVQLYQLTFFEQCDVDAC